MTTPGNFMLREEGFDPQKLHHHETIFTIGNGYLSTRGGFEEGFPGERKATLMHGVFDDIPIVFTELANAPDWTAFDIRIDGERFLLASGELLSSKRTLDLHTGLLSRRVGWRSPAGHTLDLLFERFASLDDPHILCQRVAIRPVDFSGEIEIRCGLNGAEDTLGYLHWRAIDQRASGDTACLHLETRQSGIKLGLAMRLISAGDTPARREAWEAERQPTLVLARPVNQGDSLTVEKIVTVFTSRDLADPLKAALDKLESLPDLAWETLFTASRGAWERYWDVSDVIVEGDDDSQLALRFNIFQLLIAAPRHDEKVSIGAKTLSGFGYRGHAFWDTETFMLPFFIFTQPEIARNLLSYRWHTLPGARQKASEAGLRGAQYPWESAATGDEVTPTWVPDPADRTKLIRIWTGDIEIHVSADIAYAIMLYWRVTGDDHFMVDRGAQILFETAMFWASRAEWDAATGRYGFSDVIGPDEYHDHVDQNTYTNTFARWHLLTALSVLDWLKENHPDAARRLSTELQLDDEELGRWKHVAEAMYLPQDPETGLIEQFAGYFRREDVDLNAYQDRTESMQSLLGIEGVSLTQIIKQPDVLMLFYLLPELFDDEIVRINTEYYSARTDHTFGSSLGPAIQSIIACKVGKIEEAFEHFQRAANADLYDVRGNAGDGIHGASAGGLWQAAVFGFGGLHLTESGWTNQPSLPAHWKRLAYKFIYKGELQTVDLRNPVSQVGG